jgi:two-component system OmpR family response regulator
MNTPRTRKVLVVDDDPHIREVVCFTLHKAGFSTIEAANGEVALELFRREAPDVVVLDILMPELDGIGVCRALRRTSSVPVLFLSSKDDEVDRIVGLELGADDYITKPFSPRELAARVRALLRRVDGSFENGQAVVHAGALRLEPASLQAYWNDAPLNLTYTEFCLLKMLAANPGRVLTRDVLMQSAYEQPRIVSDRTIDSHVRRLREKLSQAGGNPIHTVHGVGYRLVADR